LSVGRLLTQVNSGEEVAGACRSALSLWPCVLRNQGLSAMALFALAAAPSDQMEKPVTAPFEAPNNRLEVLSEQQCRELLASRDLGRIAFPLGDETEIFPVNYATDGVIVVFRTDPGTKLSQVMVSRVSFEVDDWDAAAQVGWSVVLKGVAQEVTAGIDPFSTTLRARNVEPLTPGEHSHWIAIYPAEISGRRFRRG
jgi:uncharacterized protein